MHDLAQDPAYADELAAFEKDLRRMLDPEAVDRRAKDDQNALVARHGGPEAALKLGTRARRRRRRNSMRGSGMTYCLQCETR